MLCAFFIHVHPRHPPRKTLNISIHTSLHTSPLHTTTRAGDAATIEQPRALDYADELFAKYDRNNDERLQLEELQALLKEASEQFPHLKEHATFLEGCVLVVLVVVYTCVWMYMWLCIHVYVRSCGRACAPTLIHYTVYIAPFGQHIPTFPSFPFPTVNLACSVSVAW